jgi:hypothetical protein
MFAQLGEAFALGWRHGVNLLAGQGNEQSGDLVGNGHRAPSMAQLYPREQLGILPWRRDTSTIIYNHLRALVSVSANATGMEKQIVTLHIRVSERVASGLKQLAAADHRKLSPYIGLVLERHVGQAEASGELKSAKATKTKD